MTTGDSVDFDAWLAQAWADHGDEPHAVADRLAAFLPSLAAATQVVPFARLATHVHGEHLGQWQRGIDLIERLCASPVHDGSAATRAALERNVRTLRYASGDATVLDDLSRDDRIVVLATVAPALAGRYDCARANAAYAAALELAERDGAPDAAATRALAVGGNNLAAALEEKADRDAAATQGMVRAAEGGLTYWRLAGTWLEEERALHRLARSLLAAGEPARAAQAAQQCVDVCVAHDAPALEFFFAHAALAFAQQGDASARSHAREAALRYFGQLAPDEQGWCSDDVAALARMAPKPGSA